MFENTPVESKETTQSSALEQRGISGEVFANDNESSEREEAVSNKDEARIAELRLGLDSSGEQSEKTQQKKVTLGETHLRPDEQTWLIEHFEVTSDQKLDSEQIVSLAEGVEAKRRQVGAFWKRIFKKSSPVSLRRIETVLHEVAELQENFVDRN